MRKDPFRGHVPYVVARATDGRLTVEADCTKDGRWFEVTLSNVMGEDVPLGTVDGIRRVTNSSRDALETYRWFLWLLRSDRREFLMEGGWPSRKTLDGEADRSERWLRRAKSRRAAEIRAEERRRAKEEGR